MEEPVRFGLRRRLVGRTFVSDTLFLEVTVSHLIHDWSVFEVSSSLSHDEDGGVTAVRRACSTKSMDQALTLGLWNASSDMQCFGNVRRSRT